MSTLDDVLVSRARWTTLVGDVRETLRSVPDGCAQTCVTSPPYFGLRDYGAAGQIGHEASPREFVEALVGVMREVRRVLADDGTLWLNIGDSYASDTKGSGGKGKNRLGPNRDLQNMDHQRFAPRKFNHDAKPKDLLGIPWRLAFALQDDGWYLRSDIIWCLSGGAVVYARTQKGDAPTTVKDLVRLDPATVQLWNGAKWTRVLGWGASNDTSERIELVLRSGERVGCTGGHEWPTQRGNVAARDLRVGDVVATCELPEPDGAIAPGYMTTDAAWLAGLYLAEGSRADDTVQLALHADEVPWLPRIEAVARHLGGSMTYTLDGNSLAVRLYGRVVVAMVESYIGGATAHDKHVTNAAWRLPNTHLRALAQGYLGGDGSLDAANDRVRLAFARNYALERDLRTLAARLGATLTLRPSTAKCGGRAFPSFRGEWRWTRSGHHNERDRGDVVEIRASKARKFWDIAVEDEPHLFALASGVLTHNCKPNPMPESVTDRPTRAHEYVFLLSKRARYFYDADAIREAFADDRNGASGAVVRKGNPDRNDSGATSAPTADGRNARDVWTIAPEPFRGAHFATMPPALARRCILAGSRRGDIVLDPFGGAGTTALAALREGRRALLCELNPDYVEIQRKRLADDDIAAAHPTTVARDYIGQMSLFRSDDINPQPTPKRARTKKTDAA